MSNVPATNATGNAVSLTDGGEFKQIIERYLNAQNVDLAKLEKMVELQERMQRWSAETAFNNSMADAQARMRQIAADSTNSQTRSTYASYAAMDTALRPIYGDAGFALSFNTGEGAPAGHMRIVCDVSKGGHVKRYQIDMPADGKGARGNDVMTKTHAAGSAVTYGMRYLLKMIFNVAVGEADDDGNAAGKRMSSRERNDLRMQASGDPVAEADRIKDEWGDAQGDRLLNAMRPDEVVVWDESAITSKAQFLATTREHIRVATDGQALADWWNSEDQKQARRDFELTRNELASIRDFIKARLAKLREGGQ